MLSLETLEPETDCKFQVERTPPLVTCNRPGMLNVEKPFHISHCVRCGARNKDYKPPIQKLDVPKPIKSVLKPRAEPCVYEGGILEWCNNCSGELKHVRDCDIYGKCTRGLISDKVRTCIQCNSYDDGRERTPLLTETFPIKIDHENFIPHIPGKRFNSSIIEFQDGYLFAFRNGWAGSEVFVAVLDRKFRPTGRCEKLSLTHRDASYGREDPRLFYFNGKLHVSYIGVVGRRKTLRTNQLYASISDDLVVEKIYNPQYADRQVWEKNWMFFQYGDKLFAEYTIAPNHRILEIDGNEVKEAHLTTWNTPWECGEMRGGAPPVLVGDEWYSWFHSRTVGPDRHRYYHMGVYTFSKDPPFNVLRVTPEPIVTADRVTKPADQYASVIFPGGAIRMDDWIVCSGVHDRWAEIDRFDVAFVESKLVKV